jgi:hypothetical protein
MLVNEGYIGNNEKKRKKAEKWARLGHFTIHTPEEYRNFLKKAGFFNINTIENKAKGWIVAISFKSL